MPIRLKSGGVEIIFKVYIDATPLVGRIKRTTTLISIGILFTFGLLYGVLFFIVRRGDRLMRSQYSELAEKEDRFRTVIENMQEGFVLYGPDDRLIMHNGAFLKLHDNIRGFIKPGMLFADFVQENINAGIFNVDATLDEEFIKKRVERHRFPKGPIIIRFTNGAVRINNETRLPDGSIISIQTDITEITKAQEEIEKQKTLFETVFNNVPYALVMINMEREVMYCNPAFLSMFGYKKGEVEGQFTNQFYANQKEFEERTHFRHLVYEEGGRQTNLVQYKRKKRRGVSC